MKLAEKIIKDTKIDEKVKPQFFDEADGLVAVLNKQLKASQDKDFKQVLKAVIELMVEIDAVDEEGALKAIASLTKIIKAKKIEEASISEADKKEVSAAKDTLMKSLNSKFMTNDLGKDLMAIATGAEFSVKVKVLGLDKPKG